MIRLEIFQENHNRVPNGARLHQALLVVKVKIVVARYGVLMGKFLEKLIEREWNSDRTEVTKAAKRRIRRILEGYGGSWVSQSQG